MHAKEIGVWKIIAARIIVVNQSHMTELIVSLQRNARRQSARKALKVDMTPMVDLGFLLITFFIFTTSLSEQKTMQLIVPADGPAMNLPASSALTLLLAADNKVFVYSGPLQQALNEHQIAITNYNTYSGVGAVIRQQQKRLFTTGRKENLMLLIKPATEATYQNIIDALDEVQINGVKRYAIVPPNEAEANYIS